ncbi:uncharacterized protein LOC116417280 isoform X2 [Nasonia vitripennis]|nr:uncharacterized protein LOC116417280 isoform X2 [Nasonia vitripennis]XP_031785606.1 uncharacterized protein LOC116417280 isoform X2 [Nasonia vitripennis]
MTTVTKEENIHCHNYTEFCNTYLKIPKFNSNWFSNPPNIDAIRGVCQTMLKRPVCQDPHEEICAAKRCPNTYESKM